MRMAKERIGPVPLAERLHPGDVDFGKVSCMLVVEVVVVRMEMAGCIIVCGGVGIVVVADTVGGRS